MEAYPELRGVLDAGGRLTKYPSKRPKQLAALCLLAGKLEKGKIYTERELNDALNEWHTFRDPATLRRELYDRFLINRAPDGSSYSVAEPLPSLSELKERFL